jgi:hypothetical protein
MADEAKRRPCPNLGANRARCSCPQDCPRRGLCCECIAFHAALGEAPHCVRDALAPAGTGAAPASGAAAKGGALKTLDTPGFQIMNYASCAG